MATDHLPKHPRYLGPYRVLGLVGRGGMAQVYAVVDPISYERLALKVMQPGAMTERFTREARLQRRIAHENVLSILDMVELHQQRALLLPLVEGPNLRRLLAETDLPLPQLLAVFREVVQGVAAIHGHGLVHRDIKPGNVLLDTSSGALRVMVADFGLAKGLTQGDARLTVTGVMLGTPAYMAPEHRADPSRVDARADVWSLGAVLHELLTGEIPPRDSHQLDIPRIPGWDDLTRRLLAASPTDRPDDARAVLALLPATEALSAELFAVCRARVPVPGAGVATVAPADTTLASIPNNLPPECDVFIGRDEALAALAARVADGHRLVSVVGIGGLGKTRLVLQYAARWLDDYPGGVWVCDLSEARSLDGLVHAVAKALDVRLDQGDSVTRLGHAIAARGRCLLILDNFEQVAEHAAETLGRWVERASGAQFVVTSRHALLLPAETILELSLLTSAEAHALFVCRAQQAHKGFAPAAREHDAIADLVEQLDRLPLAIELAAAWVSMMPPSAIREEMDHRFELLVSVTASEARQGTLRAVLDWSWGLLSADEQETLAQLSVFEGDFSLASAKAVVALHSAWVPQIVRQLVAKSLVHRAAAERFRLLVSVKEYAAKRLVEGDGVAMAEERHGTHFAKFGSKAALSALDTHGGKERHRALARELDNLVVASRRAVRRGDGEVAGATVCAAWAVLELRGPLRLGVILLDQVIQVASTSPAIWERAGTARIFLGQAEQALAHYETALALHRRAGDRRGEGLLIRQLGFRCRFLGRLDEARSHFEEALAICREVGERQVEGVVLTDLGTICHEQSRYGEAMAYFEAALPIHRELGDRRREGIVLGNLGLVPLDQGRYDEAVGYFEAALAIHREVGSRSSEAMFSCNLGIVRHEQGRYDEALAHFEAALALHRKVGDRRFESIVLNSLGNLRQEQGRPHEARTHFEEALVICREVGDRRAEGIVLGNLGLLPTYGRYDEALACLEEALAIHREVGERRAEGNVLNGLGALHYDFGRHDRALACFQAAQEIHRQVKNRRFEGIVLGDLGHLHREQGRYDEARSCLEEALITCREVGDRRTEGTVLDRLGALHREQGRHDEARAHFEAAQTVFREIGEQLNEGVVLDGLGALLLEQGRYDEARACLDAALAIHREAGSRRHEGIVLRLLSAMHREQGREEEARGCLREGERIVREVSELVELGKLLCDRAVDELRAGEPQTARTTLAEADELARAAGASAASSLGRALAGTRALLGPRRE